MDFRHAGKLYGHISYAKSLSTICTRVLSPGLGTLNLLMYKSFQDDGDEIKEAAPKRDDE